MTNQHPIVPSPEQVDQWFDDAVRLTGTPKYHIARQAALWSADQELEACCEWQDIFNYQNASNLLRAARRPKPPSLKGQALLQLDTLNADLAMHGRGCDLSQIRRALEQLND